MVDDVTFKVVKPLGISDNFRDLKKIQISCYCDKAYKTDKNRDYILQIQTLICR